MSKSAYPHPNHPVEPKAGNEKDMFKEMIPFALYAAVPILITITIAFVFGSTR